MKEITVIAAEDSTGGEIKMKIYDQLKHEGAGVYLVKVFGSNDGIHIPYDADTTRVAASAAGGAVFEYNPNGFTAAAEAPARGTLWSLFKAFFARLFALITNKK